MKMKAGNTIIFLSLAGGLVLWVTDAVIDSLSFSHESFLKSLFATTPEEMYFRCFMMAGLLGFGFLISRMLMKRREAEERYQNIVELSSDIIYTTDRDGKHTFMNDAGFRILEYAPDEVIGRPLADFLHPEDREQSLEKWEEMARLNVDAVNFENRYLTKSGRSITVLHNVRALCDKDGKFAGTQGIARDMTLRKLVEAELKSTMAKIADEKARSESILEAIGDGISIMDGDFKVLYQNQVHQKMVGGDKTGQYCYRAYADGDTVCPGCPVARSFREGGMHTLEKTVSRNGKAAVLEIKSSLLVDFSGKTIGGIETVQDITERKKTGERLTLYSEAIEEAMDGIQIVDLDGVIVYSNKAVQEIYGYAPAELIGRHVNDMNADKRFAEAVIFPSIKKEGRWSGEVSVTHKNGRPFPIWLSASLVKDEQGIPIAMVGVIRDITERKQVEEITKRHREHLIELVEERTTELSLMNEQLRKEIREREKMESELLKAQKLESIGILAGGIAHDFNNLLTSILGNIGLAMLDIDPADHAHRRLVFAEKASLRAQDLTRQLLTFSRGDSPIKKVTDLGELVKESAGFALRGSRVKYEFVVDGNLRLVDVDHGQLTQVIHNLVINADHAMPDGGTITIRCCNVTEGLPAVLPSRNEGYVCVSFQDRGVGIPKEHLSKVFDPYFTTKQKGSGLGLATTYSIIKKHEGHIAIESEPGKGATFTVYLPALKETLRPAKVEERPPRKGSGIVLVMDDETDVGETTCNILKKLGYDVAFAKDGDDVIDRYCQAMDGGRPYDLVIMDLTVPGGMGGTEALKKLLAIDPDVKAIVSSGYSNDPIMADFRAHGFSGVVAKPFRIKELGDEVHRVLSGQA